MLRSKAIVWITAGTLLCLAGVAVACRMNEDPALPEVGESTTAFKAEYPVAGTPVAVRSDSTEPLTPPTDQGEPAQPSANEKPAGVEERQVPLSPDVPPIPPAGVVPPPPAAAPLAPPAPVAPPVPTAPEGPVAPPAPVALEPEKESPKEAEKVEKPQEPVKSEDKAPTPVAPPTPAPSREPQTSLLQPVPPVTPVVPAPSQPTTPTEPPPSMAVLPVPTIPATPTLPASPPVATTPPPAAVEPTAPTTVVTEPKKMTQTALVYQVRSKGETFLYISKELLGTAERWREIEALNPALQSKGELPMGTWVMVPPDSDVRKLPQAVVPASAKMVSDDKPEPKSEVEPVPAIRAQTPTPRTFKAVLPLTGTYACKIDDQRVVTLPGGALEQMSSVGTLLVTPGLESCLWLATPSNAERLLKRVEQAEISDEDAVAFRKIYFARSEKVKVDPTGRITLSEELAKFGGLGKDIVLVGVDDHFELWDAARWQRYSQDKRIIKKHSSREKGRKVD